MTESSVALSSSRKLVFIIAGVVVSFLLATTLTQWRSSAIESRVGNLVDNAMPSIVQLSDARTHLRNILDSISEIEERRYEKLPLLRKTISTEVNDMEGLIQSYFSLPSFPGERKSAEGITEQLPIFVTAMDRLLNSIQSGKSAKEIDTELVKVRIEGDFLDRAIARIVDFDAATGQRLGLEIASIRTQSMDLAILLDILSVALAVLATVIAIRIKNASIKDLASRAAELESFAFRVAHDLKNPLGSIVMASELMGVAGEDPAELNKRVIIIAKRMDQVIEGLLDFARSGARPAIGENTEVGAIMDSTLASVLPDAELCNVRVETQPFSRTLKVVCTSGVLASIFQNLIRNALRYIVDGINPNRKIIVRVVELGAVVRIEVEDNGPGIPEETISLIFRPYFRGNNKHRGLGLGLATVKRLTEAYGGKVGVRSILGEGSCFWFELPKAT